MERRSSGPILGVAALAAAVMMSWPAAGVQRVAVLVGVNTGGADDQDLKFAARDAKKVQEVLLELGRFLPDNSLLMIEADVRAVRQALATATEKIRDAKDPESLFLFYYSGHADRKSLRLGHDRLPLDELYQLVAGVEAKVRVVILDSCRSGAITRFKGGRRGPAFEVRLEDRLAAHGQILISSSSENEVAQESEELGGSFFTHYLVSALRGDADQSGDGQVSLSEAYSYAYHHTVEGTSETMAGSQHPTYRFDIAGAGDIVLTSLSDGRSILLFPAEAKGDFLIWDRSHRAVVAEVRLEGGQERRIALQPGSYVVKQRLEDHLRIAEIGMEKDVVEVLRLDAMQRVEFADDVTKESTEEPFRLSVSARFGFQEFIDGRTRMDLIAPTFVYGLEVSLNRLAFDLMDLRLDFTISRGEQIFRLGDRDVPGIFTELNFGISMPFVFRWRFLSAHAGPRVAGLYLIRGFPEADYSQSHFTISPGLVMGFGVTAFDYLTVEVDLRFNYLYLKFDDEVRNLGYYEVFLGLSWSFEL